MARPARSIGNENVENEIVNLDGSEIMERPEDSVETQLVDVERGGAEDLVEAIDGDQLEGDIDQLVSHAENVEAALEDGGMDERAARATEIAVEDICGRWNIKRAKVGTENYASGSSRMSATRLGLESIIDSAKEGIRQLIEWVKRRIAALKDVWRKYVNVGKSIKARAEKLRKRVGKLSGSPDKDEKVEGNKVWQIAFADKVDLQKLRSTTAADINNLGDVLGSAVDASLNEADKQFETAFEAGPAKPDASGNNFARAKLVWEINGSTSKFNKHLPSGVKSAKIYGVFGGIVLQYNLPDSQITCIRFVQCKPEDIDNIELAPLDTKDMDDVLDAVYVAGGQLEDYIKKFSKVERTMDKLKKTLDKATTKAGKEAGKKDVKADTLAAGRSSIKAAKAAFENAQELDKLYRGAMVNFSMGAMAYVTASFPAYRDDE